MKPGSCKTLPTPEINTVRFLSLLCSLCSPRAIFSILRGWRVMGGGPPRYHYVYVEVVIWLVSKYELLILCQFGVIFVCRLIFPEKINLLTVWVWHLRPAVTWLPVAVTGTSSPTPSPTEDPTIAPAPFPTENPILSPTASPGEFKLGRV